MRDFYNRVMAIADDLQNVSLACRKAGISRSRFYELKKMFETPATEGNRARRKPRMPNQTAPQTEDHILELTRRYPTYSYLRISAKLRGQGENVTPSAVRGVWERRGLTSRERRLSWLLESTGDLPQRYTRFVRPGEDHARDASIIVAPATVPKPISFH